LAKKFVKMASINVKWLRHHVIPTTWANTLPAWAGHWILLFPPSRNVRKFSPKITIFLLLQWQPFALTQQRNYFAGHSDPEECLYHTFLSTGQTGINFFPPSSTSKWAPLIYLCSFVDHSTNVIWQPQSYPKNEGSKCLRNAGTHLQDYKVPQPRKPQSNRDWSLFMSQHDSLYLCLKMCQNLASCFQNCVLFSGH